MSEVKIIMFYNYTKKSVVSREKTEKYFPGWTPDLQGIYSSYMRGPENMINSSRY